MDTPAFEATGIRDQGSGIKDQGSRIKDQASTRHRLSGFFYVLFVALSLLAAVKSAHAGGTIPRTQNYYAAAPCYTPQAPLNSVLACRVAYIQSWYGSAYSVALVSYNLPPPTGSNVGNMYLSITRKSNGTVTYTTQGLYRGSLACPANSTGTTTCTCDTGYQPDPTATSCVPVPVATCTYTKVADVTDPVAKLYDDGTYDDTNPDIEHLTPATQTGIACIQQKVAAINCYMTPRPTSGYRPTAYQAHIREVYDKWEGVQGIKDNNTPECAEVKAAIYAEWLNHKPFARRPGDTSNHSQVDAQGNPAGDAVDISFVPDDANVSADAIACQCDMYRPLINMPDPTKNDPVHYQPRTCPR